MKSFRFTKIYIIESLLKNDINETSLRVVAPALHQAIQDKISELKINDASLNNLSCEFLKINNEADFNSIWKKIINECNNGVFPLIHFVCHGTNDGILFAMDKEYRIVSWSSIEKLLAKVNLLCRNNLFVTMCVCHGYWSMMHILDQDSIIPFCALLASPNEISSDEANILLPNFYIDLFRTQNLSESYSRLKENIEKYKDDLNNMDSRWHLGMSDIMFTRAARGDYEKRSTLYRIRQMAKYAFRKEGYKVINERMIRWYMGQNFKRVPSIYAELRKQKFMLDLYPEEESRFEIPPTYDELRRSPIEFDGKCKDTLVIMSKN